jgi:hypothetical protein
MKKSLFLLILSFSIPCLLQAQKYFPLPDSGAVWTSAKIDTTGKGIYVENIKFLISSDTVIKGITYKKVYSTTDSIVNYPKMEYFGCIREDANKRWLTIMAKDTQSLPLYDFSLKVGDSVLSFRYFPGGGGIGYLKVLSTDSIFIYNSYRKRINLVTMFLYKDFYASWIEGIGSLNQLYLSVVVIWYFDYKLLCFEENGILKYHNAPNSSCYYVSIRDNQSTKSQSVKAYPNPVTAGQQVYIDHLPQGAYHLTIVDLFGRNNSDYTFTTSGQVTFPAGLQTGIYIVKLNGPDYFYGYFKLIVQ